MQFLMRFAMVLGALMAVSCGSEPAHDSAELPTTVELPEAIVNHVARKAKGGRRSQIRAVIATKRHTQDEIEHFAMLLTEHYQFDHALVTFFDDASVFSDWDGKGSLVDSDWPHCLCTVIVDGETTVFKLAIDERTGVGRTDVVPATDVLPATTKGSAKTK